MKHQHEGNCIVCKEPFMKIPDSTFATVGDGEICQDCACEIVEKNWERLKSRGNVEVNT